MEGTTSTTERLPSLFSSTIIMQKEDRDRMQGCQIGVANLSDHSPIYLKIYVKSRQKDTFWRLNVRILNNKQVVEQIKTEIQKYLEENDNDETDPAMLCDALKAVIQGQYNLAKNERGEKPN